MTASEQLRSAGYVWDETAKRWKSPINHDSGLRSVQPKPAQWVPLDAGPKGEEESWYETARCFEIVFTVYSRRPCDWDGYDIKALQDFLIKAGVIPDDGWAVVSGRVVSRKASTEGEEKTVIEVRPVESLQ